MLTVFDGLIVKICKNQSRKKNEAVDTFKYIKQNMPCCMITKKLKSERKKSISL